MGHTRDAVREQTAPKGLPVRDLLHGTRPGEAPPETDSRLVGAGARGEWLKGQGFLLCPSYRRQPYRSANRRKTAKPTRDVPPRSPRQAAGWVPVTVSAACGSDLQASVLEPKLNHPTQHHRGPRAQRPLTAAAGLCPHPLGPACHGLLQRPGTGVPHRPPTEAHRDQAALHEARKLKDS